ncbi:MAG: malto-oligosyltrehalose synthase, partial [Thermoproteota archaeon]
NEAEKDLSGLIDNLFSKIGEGKIKLFLILLTLKTREEKPKLFQKGSYIPLEVKGEFKGHIISFAREYRENWAITIVPRFLTKVVENDEIPIGKVWKDTEILLPEKAPKFWKNKITEDVVKSKGALPVRRLLQEFPVALLINGKKKNKTRG